jgi:voltage-gated potassium channel
MKKLRVLKSILIRTHATQILLSYLLFLLADALVIQLAEPHIHTYRDALWYCYAVISTVGFGDIVVTTLIAKTASVLLTIYSIIVIALVTGVIVNYYNQLIQIRQKETLAAFIDKLQRLPELSQEELTIMSERAKLFLGEKNEKTEKIMDMNGREDEN